jgi:hypothetical protein
MKADAMTKNVSLEGATSFAFPLSLEGDGDSLIFFGAGFGAGKVEGPTFESS